MGKGPQLGSRAVGQVMNEGVGRGALDAGLPQQAGLRGSGEQEKDRGALGSRAGRCETGPRGCARVSALRAGTWSLVCREITTHGPAGNITHVLAQCYAGMLLPTQTCLRDSPRGHHPTQGRLSCHPPSPQGFRPVGLPQRPA